MWPLLLTYLLKQRINTDVNEMKCLPPIRYIRASHATLFDGHPVFLFVISRTWYSGGLHCTRIFENSKENLSGEPFEKNFEKSQRERGKIPRFRGYNPPEPRDSQSWKPAELIIPDARSAHTLHTVNQCTPRTPIPA